MRAWNNALADATASFPTSVYAGIDVRQYAAYGSDSDTATVPGTPYKLILDFRPVRGKLSITLNGAAASLQEWGSAPGSVGRVAVNYVTGELQFHASDTGKTAVATLTEHRGSTWNAADVNRLYAEIAAMQTMLRSGDVNLASVTGVNGKTAGQSSLTALTGNAIITGAVVHCTAASAITVGPTLGISTTNGGFEIFLAQAATYMTAAGKCYVFTADGTGGFYLASGSTAKLDISVGATGTSQTLSCYLRGFYV